MLLEIKNLKAFFYTDKGIVKAVNEVSFSIEKGETLGIVGESGSGKSVCQLSYLKLLPSPPLRIVGGQAIFEGKDLLTSTSSELRAIRGSQISMIFQDPMSSINPYLRIGTQLIEPLQVHDKLTKKEALREAEATLSRVGIPNGQHALRAFPHEFSGGMRQRVMIAMALTTNPKLLIADEPTTALDVTVQAQILDLLKNIQRETQMAIIFITHDLGILAGIADRMIVMYGGRVLEEGKTDQLFYNAQNPYTYALLQSTPRMDKIQNVLQTISGSPPDLSRINEGCPFYERCGYRLDTCLETFPRAHDSGPSHRSFCHLERFSP